MQSSPVDRPVMGRFLGPWFSSHGFQSRRTQRLRERERDGGGRWGVGTGDGAVEGERERERSEVRLWEKRFRGSPDRFPNPSSNHFLGTCGIPALGFWEIAL